MYFREKMFRFMNGRNGIDSICFAVLFIYLFFTIINAFVRSPIIYIIMLVLVTYISFRVLSRNILKRRAESEKFMRFWNKIKSRFEMLGRKSKDKMHIYRKCPNCKAVLRLPRKKGKHMVECPKCRKDFKVRVMA